MTSCLMNLPSLQVIGTRNICFVFLRFSIPGIQYSTLWYQGSYFRIQPYAHKTRGAVR